MDSQGVLASGMLLLRHGAQVGMKDAEGRIPLHLCYAACARARKGVTGGPFLSLLLSHAGQNDVYTHDNDGNAPRDLYEEPPEYEFSDGLHLGQLSLKIRNRNVVKKAHATSHGFAHTTVGGSGEGVIPAYAHPPAQKKSQDGHGLQLEDVEPDDAINDYLSTIRQRAGQTEKTKGGKGTSRGWGVAGLPASVRSKDALSFGWAKESVVYAPPAVADETLMSLKRPNKGPLLKR